MLAVTELGKARQLALTPQNELKMTGDVARLIDEAQARGNRVTWQEDEKTWGTTEKWAYPKVEGLKLVEDCDGISLYKHQLLVNAGVPAAALAMAICYDPEGRGHAVLCVRTDKGDLVLCNQHDHVVTPLVMRRERYRFLFRQQWGNGVDQAWDVLSQ